VVLETVTEVVAVVMEDIKNGGIGGGGRY
jgi:hypothetical protein